MTTETNATVPAAPEPEYRPKKSKLPPAIRAMRPRQWIKNVLVLAAPLTAGVIFQPEMLKNVALAFISFSLISATIYLLNDAKDVEEDRLHPRKRFRPIAAGELNVSTAYVLAAITCVLALTIGFFTAKLLGVVLLIYFILQLGYTQFLKNQPIIDLAMVASGFLLRMIAGGVATHVPISTWFLLVAAFGSLFMVAGKRYSEMVALGADAGTRKSLKAYTVSYLRFAWHLSAAITVMSYCLWAIDPHQSERGPLDVPWTIISIIPMTLGILQYALEVDRGDAGEPEDVVLKHRALQISGLLLVVLIAVAVFL